VEAAVGNKKVPKVMAGVNTIIFLPGKRFTTSLKQTGIVRNVVYRTIHFQAMRPQRKSTGK